MNLFGVGLPEIALIMVVGFLVLGPARTMEMARTTGRVWREVRRTIGEITEAAALDDRRPGDDRRPRDDRRPGPPNPTGPGPREDPPGPDTR